MEKMTILEYLKGLKAEHEENKELGIEYLRRYGGGFRFRAVKTHERIAKLIIGLELNISEFYREHGSLENLNIRGIGKQTKIKLEKILNEFAQSNQTT